MSSIVVVPDRRCCDGCVWNVTIFQPSKAMRICENNQAVFKHCLYDHLDDTVAWLKELKNIWASRSLFLRLFMFTDQDAK